MIVYGSIMEFNTTDANASSDELFKNAIQVRLPAVVFLSFLMPLGIFGNLLVIYMYGVRLKSNNLHLFITLLAFLDISICLIGFPLEIVELRAVYAYPHRYLCKFQKFVNYYYCVSSVLVLLTISIERYFLVCRATKPQITPTHARVLVGVIIFLSALFAVPVTISFDMASSLTNNVTITQCYFRYTPLAWAYYMTLFPANLSVLILMFFLYFQVWKTARQHFIQDGPTRHTNSFDADSNRELSSKRKLTRTNRTMIGITVAYTVSFLPTLVVGLTSYFFQDTDVTSVQESIILLLYRSWILNGALNPAVYGFCNKTFRRELLKILASMSPFKKRTHRMNPDNNDRTLNYNNNNYISSSTTVHE